MADAVAVIAEGWEIVYVSLAVHPVLSVTVTVYVPAISPDIEEPVPPLLQLYVYVAMPPETAKEILPVDAPLQRTFVMVSVIEIAEGVVIVTELLVEQPLIFVTVAV